MWEAGNYGQEVIGYQDEAGALIQAAQVWVWDIQGICKLRRLGRCHA